MEFSCDMSQVKPGLVVGSTSNMKFLAKPPCVLATSDGKNNSLKFA